MNLVSAVGYRFETLASLILNLIKLKESVLIYRFSRLME